MTLMFIHFDKILFIFLAFELEMFPHYGFNQIKYKMEIMTLRELFTFTFVCSAGLWISFPFFGGFYCTTTTMENMKIDLLLNIEILEVQ